MGYISEFLDMLRVKWQMYSTKRNLQPEREDLRFCYDILSDVSRSFAVVIANLDDEDLRHGICIFYLVLRALDTIEDDMSVPVEEKLRELPKFHTHLQDFEWHRDDVGEGRERELVQQFYRVSKEHAKLKKEYQRIIEDICEQMANGMCEFLRRSVVTKADYNLYCHYVAGLVGHGLTRLFANCGFEDPHLGDDLSDSNEMGLFLQKTNIIRDYFEDIREEPPRAFWPKEIWGNYAKELKEFMDPNNTVRSLQCLDAMVADALSHIPAVLRYLSALRDPSVFRFCAIPQVMAIATLTAVYHNADTFQVKVKITRGQSCHIMVRCADMYDSIILFEEYVNLLLSKLAKEDASTPAIRESLQQSLSVIADMKKTRTPAPRIRTLLSSYPGLGGTLLLSVFDYVLGFFSSSSSSEVGEHKKTQ